MEYRGDGEDPLALHTCSACTLGLRKLYAYPAVRGLYAEGRLSRHTGERIYRIGTVKL
jgi:hypothetical protein